MRNLLKLIGILFVLFLLALPPSGCDFDSGMVLVLKVDTPKDGSTVDTPAVTVSGRVVGTESKGAKVSINDVDAPVTDGKYSANVTLKEGKNVIKIVAKSGQAAPTEEVTVTYAPVKK